VWRGSRESRLRPGRGRRECRYLALLSTSLFDAGLDESHFGEDLVGGGGPGEGLRVGVPGRDVVADLGGEDLDRSERAAADRLAGDDREPCFDLVDPRPTGVKWKCTCWFFCSQAMMSGVVCVDRLSRTTWICLPVCGATALFQERQEIRLVASGFAISLSCRAGRSHGCFLGDAELDGQQRLRAVEIWVFSSIERGMSANKRPRWTSTSQAAPRTSETISTRRGCMGASMLPRQDRIIWRFARVSGNRPQDGQASRTEPASSSTATFTAH
jgi:hypothetical protein